MTEASNLGFGASAPVQLSACWGLRCLSGSGVRPDRWQNMVASVPGGFGARDYCCLTSELTSELLCFASPCGCPEALLPIWASVPGCIWLLLAACAVSSGLVPGDLIRHGILGFWSIGSGEER